MFGGLFGASTFLDADVEEWLFETWAWLMHEFGGMAQLRWNKIVLPTAQFFPPTTAVGAERATYLFERVQGLMGMADMPYELEPCAPPPSVKSVAGIHASASARGVPGRLVVSGKTVTIGYDPDLETNPEALIAVFAHELSRYRLTRSGSSAPGGAEVVDLTTELAVAFWGFGVFNANIAFDFHATTGGNYGGSFSAQTTGYFSEESWAFAIALFCALKGAEPPFVYLKESVAGLAKDAAHYLKHHDALLEPLRKIS